MFMTAILEQGVGWERTSHESLNIETVQGRKKKNNVQVWLCGGRVLVAPCSRIGHVFRMWRPYKGKAGMDTNLYNSIRVAKTWLGDYEVSLGPWLEVLEG